MSHNHNHQHDAHEEDHLVHNHNQVHSHDHSNQKGHYEMGNNKYQDKKGDHICILENDKDFQEKLKQGNKAFNQLLVVVIICFIFMIVEIIGGIMSGSLAILTDAAHMCSDVGGFMISMFSIKIGQKVATYNNTFGFHRAEILGALASVLIIWAMVLWLAWEATNRIICYTMAEKFPGQCAGDGDDIDANIMLITAFISLACNIFNLIALGHCPVPCIDSAKQHSIMDSVMSVYKPHGGHDCGGHDHGPGGHDHGHSHGHDHGHSHAKKPEAHSHEGHNHGAGGCSGHGHSHAKEEPHSHEHNHNNDYAEIKAEGQSEQEFADAQKNLVKIQQDSILSRASNVENPLEAHNHGAHDHEHDHGHNHNHGDIEQKDNSPDHLISGFGGVKTGHEGHNHGAGGCSGHGHSHGHEETNINIRAAVVHVIGDMLQSIGVIIAAIAISLWPKKEDHVVIVDPICTYIFSIIVIITTIPVFKDCMNILMEGKPKEVDNKALKSKLLKINQVQDVRDLHTWTLAGGKNIMTCHIELVVNNGQSYGDRHRQVHAEVLKAVDGMNIVHVTAQIL